MSQNNRQMKLGAFFVIPGHHVAAWRHPDAQADDVMNFEFYRRLAQTAERGKFDMIFLADGLGGKTSGDISSRFVSSIFEPLTLLSSLASVTSHIGLAATVSTTYNEPFHVARKFASLDHLSGGRAAWNVVTSGNPAEAANFSKDQHLRHDLRYERAKEFVDVVTMMRLLTIRNRVFFQTLTKYEHSITKVSGSLSEVH